MHNTRFPRDAFSTRFAQQPFNHYHKQYFIAVSLSTRNRNILVYMATLEVVGSLYSSRQAAV